MRLTTRVALRSACVAVVALLSLASLGAQTPGRQGGPADSVVQQVRVALGHGKVTEARRLAEGATGAAASKDLALALVDIFEGRDEQARARLLPHAAANVRGDAALELALLEMRRGQRDAGWKRLEPIAAVREFRSPDDYFRLARAARGIREYLLANDAYVQIADVPRADIQTEWGDVFLERHQPGDAVTNFRKAIELDPEWVPAYLGMARALRDEDPEAARSALEAARKRAPEHPEVWLLIAETRLAGEDSAAAAEALDRMAATRPGSIEEAALRAAIAFADDAPAALDAALAKVREIDPRSALGFRRTGEQAAREYRFDDAAEFARKAVGVDPDDPQAQFDLGLYLMRTGDEKAARGALERSWDLDRSAPVTKNLLDVLDRLDNFEVVNHGPFVFKFAKEEAAVLRTYAVPLAEEAWKTFSARYGFTPAGPILIEVFPRHDDFAVRTLGLPGLVGALGACFGRVVTMDSPRARQPGEFSWQATLWHELAHVYTLQVSKYKVPRWLTEGVSVFEEHKRQPAWGRELSLEFAHQLSRGRTFGVKGLPDAFKEPQSLALAYFEAALLVEHLVEINGDQGLRTLLAAYADGAKDADAFTRAFGRSQDAVEVSFKAFVDQRYGALSRVMAQPPPLVAGDDIASLRTRANAAPDSFVSQLALGQALLKAGDRAGAQAALERAATLAPSATGNASPRALLAQIAEQNGDLARARRELRQLLASDHANVNAARKLAALAGDAPDAADDRDYALRLVADLDPFDAQAHGQLGARLFAKGNHAAALIEFQAALALGPANLAEAHTDIAETLLKLSRRDEAKRHALLALQQAPTFARAQDALLLAIGRE